MTLMNDGFYQVTRSAQEGLRRIHRMPLEAKLLYQLSRKPTLFLETIGDI